MTIAETSSYPTSFPVPQGGPCLGFGLAMKRDAALGAMEDSTDGWGVSHRGRARTVIEGPGQV